MLICKVNGTEVNFELKLSKYSKTFRRVILVKADFYNQKKMSFAGTSFCKCFKYLFSLTKNFQIFSDGLLSQRKKFVNFVETHF